MIRSKEDLLKALKICQNATCDECPYEDIGCKYCKYKPIAPEGITEGHQVVFPYDFDNPCPFQCGDAWYNEKPDDDFFCAYGTKMEEVNE